MLNVSAFPSPLVSVPVPTEKKSFAGPPVVSKTSDAAASPAPPLRMNPVAWIEYVSVFTMTDVVLPPPPKLSPNMLGLPRDPKVAPRLEARLFVAGALPMPSCSDGSSRSSRLVSKGTSFVGTFGGPSVGVPSSGAVGAELDPSPRGGAGKVSGMGRNPSGVEGDACGPSRMGAGGTGLPAPGDNGAVGPASKGFTIVGTRPEGEGGAQPSGIDRYASPEITGAHAAPSPPWE